MMTRLRDTSTAKLPMTPMIDVVCLLLIFFLIVFNPPETLSGIDASAAATSNGTPVAGAIAFDVTPTGYRMQGTPATLSTIDTRLARIGDYSHDLPVRVRCTRDSTHSQLVKLLDVCMRNDMRTVSIVAP